MGSIQWEYDRCRRIRSCGRQELARFLRSRRERITPAADRLRRLAGRRRTPGLRREELAQIAGVGVTWYTWLEQGRDINVPRPGGRGGVPSPPAGPP